jgi:Subtilisin inhibitor-like
MAETRRQRLDALPAPESCWIIDFDDVELITQESFPPQYVIVVSGTKPYLNMRVELLPRIYIQQPEYWGIEVVGCLPGGIGLPALAPYSVTLRLAGVTGTRGVEVIGATRTERIAVPPHEDTGAPLGNFRLSISPREGQPSAEATLTCSPDGGSHPNPAAACEQLTAAAGYIEDIPEKDGVCTREFRPVVLRASGTWAGEARHYEREFSNLCVGVLATGGVLFDVEASPVAAEADAVSSGARG